MDLGFVRGLYTYPGPFVSVYLDASRRTEDAQHAIDVRWRDARDTLAELGADGATLDSAARKVAGYRPPAGRDGMALFAANGDVLLVEAFAGAPARTVASHGALPDVMPLVALRGERVSWLRVLVDRTGADLTTATSGTVERRHRVAGGGGSPVHTSGQGGWSAPRYERATEEQWDRTAAEVATAVDAAATLAGAEVIVLAGDPRARGRLMSHLPPRWRDRVAERDEASAIADVTERHVADVLDRYHAQLGRDAAVSGVAAVVAALRRGQVDTLVMVDDRSSALQLWVGAHATDLAQSADELRASGVAEPHSVRADAAIVRALAGTDAELVLVSPGDAKLTSGIGALLRYADNAGDIVGS